MKVGELRKALAGLNADLEVEVSICISERAFQESVLHLERSDELGGKVEQVEEVHRLRAGKMVPRKVVIRSWWGE